MMVSCEIRIRIRVYEGRRAQGWGGTEGRVQSKERKSRSHPLMGSVVCASGKSVHFVRGPCMYPVVTKETDRMISCTKYNRARCVLLHSSP